MKKTIARSFKFQFLYLILIFFLTYLFLTIITADNLHNSTFPSFNLSTFTEEDGTTIKNEDKRIPNKKNAKIYSVLSLVQSSG